MAVDYEWVPIDLHIICYIKTKFHRVSFGCAFTIWITLNLFNSEFVVSKEIEKTLVLDIIMFSRRRI